MLSCRPEGGKARGLPSGIQLSQLQPQHVDAIPAVSDAGNHELGNEFFDTRQACLPSTSSLQHLV